MPIEAINRSFLSNAMNSEIGSYIQQHVNDVQKFLVELDLHLSQPCKDMALLMVQQMRMIMWFRFDLNRLAVEVRTKYMEDKKK